MDIKNKKTTLSDEAALYNHREDISEKEKWSSMSGKERWEYFKNYYLMKVLGLTVAAVAVVSLLFTILSPKEETLLSVAIANGAMTQEQYLAVQKEFDSVLGTDGKKQKTIFDGGYDFEYDLYGSMQKFAIYNAVGELDVTIMPLSVFEVYAPKEFFAQIDKTVSAELCASLSETFVKCGLNDEDGNPIENSEGIYGIRIDGTRVYEGYEVKEPVILVINLASQKTGNVEKFLQYLFAQE